MRGYAPSLSLRTTTTSNSKKLNVQPIWLSVAMVLEKGWYAVSKCEQSPVHFNFLIFFHREVDLRSLTRKRLVQLTDRYGNKCRMYATNNCI